ncbi:MAG: hypothetical protein ABL893_11765 [Hyphomicrobium sp.]|nr:hypothetical protein [Hyphomicrobium sp.]
MFRNGIYKVSYRSKDDPSSFPQDALALMRNGKIIGADRHGGVFTGEPVCGGGPLESLKLNFTLPPGGELVTGYVAGAGGACLDLNGRFDPALDRQTATVEICGAPVEVVVTYLGPLPG